MFDFFKKRPDEKAKKLVTAANNVACDFSDLIASDGIAPTLIYDVSVLPHAKDSLRSAARYGLQSVQTSPSLKGGKLSSQSSRAFRKE